MSKELEKIIKDDSLRERLGKSALSNVKRFSWEQSAQQTISILEGLSDRN
jgi:glycosyltransferase involved in cell wall biosynthesis